MGMSQNLEQSNLMLGPLLARRTHSTFLIMYAHYLRTFQVFPFYPLTFHYIPFVDSIPMMVKTNSAELLLHTPKENFKSAMKKSLEQALRASAENTSRS